MSAIAPRFTLRLLVVILIRIVLQLFSNGYGILIVVRTESMQVQRSGRHSIGSFKYRFHLGRGGEKKISWSEQKIAKAGQDTQLFVCLFRSALLTQYGVLYVIEIADSAMPSSNALEKWFRCTHGVDTWNRNSDSRDIFDVSNQTIQAS